MLSSNNTYQSGTGNINAMGELFKIVILSNLSTGAKNSLNTSFSTNIFSILLIFLIMILIFGILYFLFSIFGMPPIFNWILLGYKI